ncbi:membrane hypothetical protein [Candidatus Sulfopaludibacter sp. SbA3]|nr:membrane hypothetical protein [Candidatus Sulfopaludibacter sp. SbA3]
MRAPSEWKSFTARYGGAAVCLAASLLLRRAVDPLLGARNPYTLTVLSVLISARYFGIGPSIMTTVLGAAAATWFFAGGWAALLGPQFSLVLGFYFLVCGAAIWLMEMQRRDHRRAEENARLASQRLADLQRETAERERQQSVSAKLRAIVESSEDAIISKDLEGVIQSWNQAAERMFGYTSGEMVGKTMAALLLPERRQEESDIIERIRHGGRVKHFETVRLRKNGTPIPVSLTISPIHDESGKVVGASHIGRDITEQKQMEEQMRQTQKLESLGVLAGGLAHDFNTASWATPAWRWRIYAIRKPRARTWPRSCRPASAQPCWCGRCWRMREREGTSSSLPTCRSRSPKSPLSFAPPFRARSNSSWISLPPPPAWMPTARNCSSSS